MRSLLRLNNSLGVDTSGRCGVASVAGARSAGLLLLGSVAAVSLDGRSVCVDLLRLADGLSRDSDGLGNRCSDSRLSGLKRGNSLNGNLTLGTTVIVAPRDVEPVLAEAVDEVGEFVVVLALSNDSFDGVDGLLVESIDVSGEISLGLINDLNLIVMEFS